LARVYARASNITHVMFNLLWIPLLEILRKGEVITGPE
jgi:hypothetical protein